MRRDWRRVAADAIGLAFLTMYVTGTFHPPAGVNPLLVVSNNLPLSFLFAPVLASALLLTAFAYLAPLGPPASVAATLVVKPAGHRWRAFKRGGGGSH